ncbi:hypothetical protein CEXT_604321 [Caerostris extrusa]|uniref:Reverse transcriptase n=1 Tax=Caerostris extrusa TaxID=172846 RepID=A0AAV4MCX5_CAEEX|nr:hypothetical protein CEXT_604321 [Caerostris extrusa]
MISKRPFNNQRSALDILSGWLAGWLGEWLKIAFLKATQWNCLKLAGGLRRRSTKNFQSPAGVLPLTYETIMALIKRACQELSAET